MQKIKIPQIDQLRRALELDHPYRFGRFPGELRKAGVLLLFELSPGDVCSWNLWMIQRAMGEGIHQGQFAFPGGRYEESDQDLEMTAKRETFEEIGVHESTYQILGQLPSVTTPSLYEVFPFVAVLHSPLNPKSLSIQREEVSDLFPLPLHQIHLEVIHQKEVRERGGQNYELDVFHYQDKKIWGASAAMLGNLLERLEGCYL